MKTVLVAEDNAVNRELVTEMLEALGYHVLQACDGKEALEQLAAQLPEVVLLDLQMPCMDGRETLRHIRQNPSWKHLPVIACTAFAMQGDREEILGLSFNGYISKPVSIAALMAALQSVS